MRYQICTRSGFWKDAFTFITLANFQVKKRAFSHQLETLSWLIGEANWEN